VTPLFRLLLAGTLAWALLSPALAQKPPEAGVVLLHGLGGSPRSMEPLARALRDKGHAVSSPDMPWSAARLHDLPVAAAEQRVLAELQALRAQGARKVFIAGFSKGGLFAAYMATRTRIDGLAAIAPNGGSNNAWHAEGLARARALIAEGRGDERVTLDQYWPPADRAYPVVSIPSAYVTWFEPDGPMNAARIYGDQPPGMPVLLVVPTRDFENLRKAKNVIFGALPPNPLHRLFEPAATHAGAVEASAAEVVRWIDRVVASGPAP
jgi:dienelactone hydrolase